MFSIPAVYLIRQGAAAPERRMGTRKGLFLHLLIYSSITLNSDLRMHSPSALRCYAVLQGSTQKEEKDIGPKKETQKWILRFISISCCISHPPGGRRPSAEDGNTKKCLFLYLLLCVPIYGCTPHQISVERLVFFFDFL